MDIMCATIFDENIDNNFWLEVILVITQVKNVRLIKVLKKKSLYKTFFIRSLNMTHLYILESMVNVFIYEEKRDLISKNLML